MPSELRRARSASPWRRARGRRRPAPCAARTPPCPSVRPTPSPPAAMHSITSDAPRIAQRRPSARARCSHARRDSPAHARRVIGCFAPAARALIALGEQHGRDRRTHDAVTRRRRLRQLRESPLEPLDLDRAGAELRVLHHAQVEVARRLHALDRELEQRAMHARDRLRAVGRPDDQLGEHRIVEQPDLAARLDAAVPADARPGGHVQVLHAAGRREEIRSRDPRS